MDDLRFVSFLGISNNNTSDVRGKIRKFRNQAIKALFAFYQSIELENFAGELI